MAALLRDDHCEQQPLPGHLERASFTSFPHFISKLELNRVHLWLHTAVFQQVVRPLGPSTAPLAECYHALQAPIVVEAILGFATDARTVVAMSAVCHQWFRAAVTDGKSSAKLWSRLLQQDLGVEWAGLGGAGSGPREVYVAAVRTRSACYRRNDLRARLQAMKSVPISSSVAQQLLFRGARLPGAGGMRIMASR
jgi:hypothetical protein